MMIELDEEQCRRFLVATARLERGDVESARRDLEILTLEAPNFVAAWDRLAACHEANGELEAAERCYRKACRLDRRNWASRYHWGTALHRAGNLPQAMRLLRAALSIAPDQRCISYWLGLSYYDLERYQEAIRYYEQALACAEREITDTEVLLALAAAHAELEAWDAADAACSRAALLSPDNPNVYYRWAVLSARGNAYEDAERLARRVEALEPRSVRGPLLLVELALDTGRWSVAEERIANIATLPHGQRLALALGAELARRTEDYAEAREQALATLGVDGQPSDQAIDIALGTLRALHGPPARCRGFRLVIEACNHDQSYFRPYVVLAENEDQALTFVTEIQDALDTAPWSVVEQETFEHQGRALLGVYQLLLARVWFPRAHGL